MEDIKEVWEILKEVGKRLDRLAKSQEETDRMLKETRELVNSLAKRQEETDKMLKETRELVDSLAESQRETDKQIKVMSKKVEEVALRVDKTTKAISDLNGIWQDYTEDTIREGLRYALSGLGFKGFKVMSNVKVEKGDDNIELDGLIFGKGYIIVLEVKTTLRVDDINEFIEKLEKKFLKFFPEYKGYKLYGAVAGMKFHQFADRFAIKKGLIVLKHKDGKDVKVLNPKDFKPKDFSGV